MKKSTFIIREHGPPYLEMAKKLHEKNSAQLNHPNNLNFYSKKHFKILNLTEEKCFQLVAI